MCYIYFYIVATDEQLQKVKVEYITLPGWKTNTEDIRTFQDLTTEGTGLCP